MPFPVIRPRKGRRRGAWARVLDDFLGVILAEIEESKLDLEELLRKAIRKVAFYFTLFVLAVSCFIFLNISAALWLQELVLDDWAAFLAIALFYAALTLAFFLINRWKESREKSPAGSQEENATSDRPQDKRGALNRDSPRMWTNEWVLPLAVVALGIGFLAAPGKKSSSPPPPAEKSRSFGLDIIVSFLAGVANRVVSRALDAYFAPGNRKSPSERS